MVGEAAKHAFHPMQRAVSCVTNDVLYGRTYHLSDVPRVMMFVGRHDGQLRERPVPIGRQPDIMLSLRHLYRVVVVPSRRGRDEWTPQAVNYSYELLEMTGQQIVGFHWHSDPREPAAYPGFPHLHIGRQFVHPSLPAPLRARAAMLVRSHVPASWVPLQAVLRFAIRELGVEPLVDRWQEILDETERGARDPLLK